MSETDMPSADQFFVLAKERRATMAAKAFLDELRSSGVQVRIHVTAETGPNIKVGAPGKDLIEAVERLRQALEKSP